MEKKIFLTKNLFGNSEYNKITINSVIRNNQFINAIQFWQRLMYCQVDYNI